MRKRLIRGAVAVVVIGVAAYVLSQPRARTVRYHKSEYLALAMGYQRGHWTDMGIVPKLVRRWHWDRRGRELEFHRKALIEGGYLKEVTVPVSNGLWLSSCMPLDVKLADQFARETVAFTTVRRSETDSAILLITPVTTAEQVAEAVRAAYDRKIE